MISIDLELGVLEKPCFDFSKEQKRLHIGFGFGTLHIAGGSIMNLAVDWYRISEAVMTEKHRKILEEGNDADVDFDVLLTRLRYETKKYCEDD